MNELSTTNAESSFETFGFRLRSFVHVHASRGAQYVVCIITAASKNVYLDIGVGWSVFLPKIKANSCSPPFNRRVNNADLFHLSIDTTFATTPASQPAIGNTILQQLIGKKMLQPMDIWLHAFTRSHRTRSSSLTPPFYLLRGVKRRPRKISIAPPPPERLHMLLRFHCPLCGASPSSPQIYVYIDCFLHCPGVQGRTGRWGRGEAWRHGGCSTTRLSGEGGCFFTPWLTPDLSTSRTSMVTANNTTLYIQSRNRVEW